MSLEWCLDTFGHFLYLSVNSSFCLNNNIGVTLKNNENKKKRTSLQATREAVYDLKAALIEMTVLNEIIIT